MLIAKNVIDKETWFRYNAATFHMFNNKTVLYIVKIVRNTINEIQSSHEKLQSLNEREKREFPLRHFYA